MKKAELAKTRAYKEESSDDDCYIEALCADNLSKVGSSDCSCSDCAEAMLEAYNQFLEEEKANVQTLKQKGRLNQGGYIRTNGNLNKNSTKELARNNKCQDCSEDQERIQYKIKGASTFNRSPRFQTNREANQSREICDRNHKHHHHHKSTYKSKTYKSLEQQQDPDSEVDIPEYEPEPIEISPTKYDFTEAQLMFYVDQKIKQNLKKHKLRERDIKKIKHQEHKHRKKALLQLDKQRKQLINAVPDKKEVKKKQTKVEPKKQQKEQQKKDDINTITGLNRMLVQQIVKEKLQQKKKLRQQQMKEAKMKVEAKANHIDLDQKPEGCKHDNCKKHHMKTDPKLINETTKKIEKNAQKYMEKLKSQKQAKETIQKMKENKLKALALKAQQKLQKSKKMGTSGRSSFHHSADHFSTFSDIRRVQEQRKIQKDLQKKLNDQINNPQRTNVHYQHQQINENENQDEHQQDDNVLEVRKPPSFSKEKKEKSVKKSVSKQKRQSQEESFSNGQNSRLPSKITKQMRQSTLNEMQKSLNKRIRPRELQQQIEVALEDPNSKFYVWDMLLDDTQVKKIFDQAKIPMQAKSKSQNKNDSGNKNKDNYREQANKKIQQNIKKKLKQKQKQKKQSAIQQKVRQKKQQIMKEYRKIKDMQTKFEQTEANDQTKSKSNPKSKNNTNSNKQIKSQFVSKIKQNQKNQPKGKPSNNPHIKQRNQQKIKKPKKIKLFEESIDLQYENKATSNLQENQIFTQNDKKIFVLNSDTLSGIKHLKV